MIDTVEKVAVRLCEVIECEECPVHLFKWEKRINVEKYLEHKPCCTNLEHWIKHMSIN